MGNDTGFYIGPYVTVGDQIEIGFDIYDLDTLKGYIRIRHISGSEPIFTTVKELLKRRVDFIGWDDCGSYPLSIDKETELQVFTESCSREIDLLKKNFENVMVEWGAVVWGEF